MKKTLLLSIILLYTLSLQAQTKIWGACSLYGPTYMSGTIFRCDADGSNPVVVYEFSSTEGYNPWSQPMLASDGNFYGTTYSGGLYDMGVIYKFDPETNAYTKLADMDGENTGSYPIASLIEATNGKLYGTTSQGGLNGDGILFTIDPSDGTFTRIKDFDYGNTGCCPYGDLFQASNGKLYQLLVGGPTMNEYGTIVEYDITLNTLVRKAVFNGSNGALPFGSLAEAENGKLYGTTEQGGENWAGVIFEYNLNTSGLSVAYAFDGAGHGKAPKGSLNPGYNGNLYGMTEVGGLNDKGVLFRFNPDSSLVVNLLDFDGSAHGAKPYGDLMTAINNKMYGFTTKGGTNDKGVLFEFDPVLKVFTKKVDFSTALGTDPFYGVLVEAPFHVGLAEASPENELSIYPNPANDKITIAVNGEIQGTSNICIFSSKGERVIDNIPCNQYKTEIDVSMLPKGIYLVKIQSDKGVEVEKLVIQ
jgi:uncharacterized repeat protein (TIGR03803 family)